MQTIDKRRLDLLASFSDGNSEGEGLIRGALALLNSHVDPRGCIEESTHCRMGLYWYLWQSQV